MSTRRKNIAAFTDSKGRVHPIRGSRGYDPEKEGEVSFDFGESSAKAKRERAKHHVKTERAQRADKKRGRADFGSIGEEDRLSLAQFVRKHHGIQARGMFKGEIERLSAKETGSSGLVARDLRRGLNAEYMRDYAAEAGLIHPEMSIGDFLSAVERSAVRRNPKKKNAARLSMADLAKLGPKYRAQIEAQLGQVEEQEERAATPKQKRAVEAKKQSIFRRVADMLSSRKRAAKKAGKLEAKAKLLRAKAARPTIRQRIKKGAAKKAHGLVSRILGNPNKALIEKYVALIKQLKADLKKAKGGDPDHYRNVKNELAMMERIVARLRAKKRNPVLDTLEVVGYSAKLKRMVIAGAVETTNSKAAIKYARERGWLKGLTKIKTRPAPSWGETPKKRRNKTVIVKPRKVTVIANRGKKRNADTQNKYLVRVDFTDGRGLSKIVPAANQRAARSAMLKRIRGESFYASKTVKRIDIEPVVISNPKQKRRNGESAADQRKMFAGRTKGIKQIFLPEGSPKTGLSTLGPLKLLVMSDGRKYKAAPGVWAVRDLKGKVYFGTTKRGASIWNGPKEDIGAVARVEYGPMSKIHLGEKRPAIFFHKFSPPLPHLKADGNGGACLAGGNFSIGSAGIEG